MKNLTLFLVSLVLLLSGCAPTNQINDWLKTSTRALHRSEPRPDPDKVRAAIALALQQENHHEAIRLLEFERGQGGAQQGDAKAWPQALNGLLMQAERQREDQEYTAAGELYRKIITHFPDNSSLAQMIEMNTAQLRARLDDCADQLLNLGLMAYRQGELRQAITIWDKIDRFHPQHKASQNALNTTRRQLENLETLPSS